MVKTVQEVYQAGLDKSTKLYAFEALSRAAPHRRGAAASMGSILEFWRGGVPLGQVFWLWGLLGGAVINLFATLLMVFLLTAGAPAWIAAVLFAAHLPVNVLLLVGVWRSAGRPRLPVTPRPSHGSRWSRGSPC